ncbi:otoferlin-like [Schistocerca cancellata]|uniref:otoferlin-like n=1 Tax=Schistocerca cancellata TaxID=274614 RepID=UPI002118FDF4|nr:otoferlin-like [Schistocerca cancellata]
MSGHLPESGHYQLCVKVIEGRHLAWLNMDPVACVQVGAEKRHTRVCDNTDCPYFNEFFVFDFRTSLTEVLERTITLSVSTLALSFVMVFVDGMSRTDHQFFHKWAALEDPANPTAGSRGFLRVDLNVSASGRAPPPQQITPEDDDIEGQLLSGGSGSGRERARYEARTSTCRGSRSPEWNERLVFYDLLPPMWQRVRLQVRHEDAVLATAHLDLATVSSPGHDGFLPTFGPAYVYLYGGDAAYRGRLLVSLRTVPAAEVTTGGTAVEPLPALDEEELWRLEEHSLFAVLLGADCIPRGLAGKAVVLQFAMGDQAGGGLASIATQAPLESVVTESGAMSIPLRAAPSRDGDAYCRLRLGTRKPCAAVRRRWPRFHTRMALSNALASLAASLESGLSELEKGKSRPTAGGDADQISTLINVGAKLREDATRLMKTTDIWAAAYTPLDIYRASKCKKLVEKLRNMAEVWQSGGPVLGFDVALSTGSLLLEELRDAIEDPQPALPDVVVRLVLATGGSVGYARLKARDLCYTEEPGLRGSMCGKVSTVILKVATNAKIKSVACLDSPLSGQDEWCAVTLLLWLGASRDAAACLRSLPPGCSPQTDGAHPLPATVTCSQQQTLLGLAHVYGGRFFPGDDESGLCDPFVRVTIAGGHTLQTEVQFGKLDPVWDQTLPFQDVVVCCSSGKFIKKHPSLIIVEVFDLDKSVRYFHG